ncbi:MAG TPA: efflux transporter outer membrane subunit [Steroidobacteraceae bacterium]|jgi:multidrug efflux system outer membrane protein|nr:efflux transporter outer membrane subunit [Steroidobacteraceae bacterium]
MRRNRAPAAVVTAAATLVAAGCAVGPDYRRPDTNTPAVYRFEPDAASDSVADAGWWQVYQDPILQALIRECLANNFDVRIAAARVDQARAVLGSTRLQQVPQIAVTASGLRQRASSYELPPGIPAINNVFTLEGSLSYEIDFWGKYRRATEAARAQLLKSTYAKQDVMAALVTSVVTDYFTLQSLDEQLVITHRTLETRQKFVDLTQAQHDRGTVSDLDVATAQAQLAIAQANLPDLLRRIGQTEDQLSVLLGHNPARIVRAAGRALPPVPAAGLPSILLERRPDLREAEESLIAANAQVGVAKANLFPNISLTAVGGGISGALSSLFSGPARVWSASGNAMQPLLNSQRSVYQVDLANAQKREALLQYQKSVQTAFQEVSDALIARQQDADLQTAEEAQVDALQRASTIALARYRVGYASYFNVIDANRDLFAAELSLSAARLNTLLSVVQLYRALGGGWQVEQAAPVAASAP